MNHRHKKAAAEKFSCRFFASRDSRTKRGMGQADLCPENQMML
jgi:hypothetical protein